MNKNNRKLPDIVNINKKLLKPAMFFAVFAFLLIFLGIRAQKSNKLTIGIGELATEDIRASKIVEDDYGTEQARIEAANKIAPKYRISPLIQMMVNDNVSKFMDSVRDVKARDDLNSYQKAVELEEISNLDLDSSLYPTPIDMEYRDLNSFENLLINLFSQTMGQGIRQDDLDYEKKSLSQVINGLEYEDSIKTLGLAIMDELIQVNEFVDEEETQRLIDNAVNNVRPIVINQNDIIVEQGSLITSHSYELIKESGLVESEGSSSIWYLGIMILVILSVFLLAIYINKFNKTILNDNRLIVTLLILILTIIISLVFNNLSTFLIPISISTILIAILIDVKLAILTNFLITGLLWLILGLDSQLVFMSTISSNLAILIDFKSNQRYSILITGLIVGTLNFIIIAAFEFMNPVNLVEFFKVGGLVFLNGIISGIISLGTLPIWENVFSILTPLKLLELINPNQPLIQRLLLEAPGTYHHSTMVGNLGEAAANKIGANSFLVKAGAIYHDIGKVVNPYYFKENQFDISNPHDLLEPSESARIITNHTSAGKKLAKSKRIPKEIIAIIEQHHGDTCVQYFYYKAKENNENTDINDFKYRGKKPQSKEAAIVMLADSSEAAVRSIKNPTKEKIEEMVSKVVKGKLNDGQLEDCDITYRDLEKIIETFVTTLIAISHDRIEYPEMKEGHA